MFLVYSNSVLVFVAYLIPTPDSNVSSLAVTFQGS